MTPPSARTRGAAGQVSAEYLGVLVVVAAIVVGLIGSGPGRALGVALSRAVCRIAHVGSCAAPPTPDGGAPISTRPITSNPRAAIDAIHRKWMADQASYQYVHGRPTPEWTMYQKYSHECWYTGASCRAAAVLALGGTRAEADRMWHTFCGPTDMSGCDIGAVVRDHLTEAILIDIPVSFATAGLVKFAAERAIFTFGSAAVETGVDSTLPKLTGTFAESFADGQYSEVTFHAGDLFYRAEAAAAPKPGSFLGLESAATADEAETLYNLEKWGNPKEVLRTYRLTEDVTMYYGDVAGGTGQQALIPDGISAKSVLELVSEAKL